MKKWFINLFNCKCKKCGKVMMDYEGEYFDEEFEQYIDSWIPLKVWERVSDICNDCEHKK